MFRRLTLGLVMSAALSACGGGGSAGSVLPQTPSNAVPAPSPTPGSSSVAIAITIPAASSKGAALRRKPLYVSTNTQSASIAINGETPIVANLSASSPNCVTVAGGGRTCTFSVNAPVGVDTFAEALYASANATGAILSQGQTSATIAAGKANTIFLTLDGVIASLALRLANATPSEGAPAQIGLTVNFNDASGASIIGSDPFVVPVTLSDSDGSGITSLSKTTLNSPADASALVVNYSGAVLAQAVIGASAGSIVAPNVTLTPQVSSPVSFNDYTTFGYDNQRDMFNPNSTAITPASLSQLHLAWQSTLGGGDYNTQTQPILATDIPGHAGVLFVGGGSGNVYGYDALSGALLWTQNLGQETYTCSGGSRTGYFGIGGTVAYDSTSKSLYVMGNANTSLNAYGNNTLSHLDAATGHILGQVNVSPSAAGPTEFDVSHTSVALNNGLAYVGIGSACDASSWRGRVVAVNVPTMTIANTFLTLWDPQNARGAGAQAWGGGSIWGWGGVSLDFGGNVLTGVGNADDRPTARLSSPFVSAPTEYSGYAETLLELTANVATVVAAHHPIPASIYGGVSTDLDVQGTPLIVQPPGCSPMVALQAKSGTLSIYNESQINTGWTAQYQLAPSQWEDAYLGEPAYSRATGLIYADVATSVAPSLFAPGLIAINPGCGNPSVTWHASFGTDSSGAGIPRAIPAASAGGVVFAGSVNGTGGSVWAINASTGAILNGGKPLLQTSGNLRVPPTIDGNWVFVLDNSGNMYGLTIDPGYPTIHAKRRANDSRQRTYWEPLPHD